jgi:hypothetical protein
VGFTDISRRTTPDRVMGMLDELYCLLDVEAEGAGLYKVETIGACGGWARGERERERGASFLGVLGRARAGCRR